MGKPTGRTKAAVALARARKFRRVDPLLTPEVVALTTRFLENKVDLLKDAVHTIIQLGGILTEGRDLDVLKGHLQRWHDRLGITSASAGHYIRLAKLAEEQPDIITKWNGLGPTKLYRVYAMLPEGRDLVLKKSLKTELVAMNDERFSALTQPHLDPKRVSLRKITPDMRAQGLRMKVQAWTKALSIARVQGTRKDAIRAGLRADLRELCRAARALEADLG